MGMAIHLIKGFRKGYWPVANTDLQGTVFINGFVTIARDIFIYPQYIVKTVWAECPDL
jgi:hypothetical protein